MSRPKLPVSIVISEDDGETLQTISNTGIKGAGVELRLTEWSGWDDTADVRANPQDVPAGDGAYDDGPLFAARTVMLKGVALADTPGALISVGRVFRRLLAGSIRSGSVAITQEGFVSAVPGSFPGLLLIPGPTLIPGAGSEETIVAEALRASIRLGGATTFSKTHPRRAEWSISLYAADARRYSVDEQTRETGPFVPSGGLAFDWTFPLTFGSVGTDGRIIAVNNGDIPTGVRLRIADGCVNPQIILVETGERLALIDDIDVDVVIDTNTRNRSVLRNDAPYGWVLTSDSEFFQLPVGTSTLLFRVDSGSSTLTATWSDATP